ncbi:hypothetical protein AB0C38_43145 [Amycolatopsis sp. NPDC048633]|uniref:hypothetical protein n=1 Tax=Amycolatopsis sp. NPDC048633 TaxID=3157095 RepID=UPI0033C0B421
MRAFWVVVFVVFSLLSTLFAGATVYSLFSGDDDLPGNAILLAGSLAFAALGWYALRLLDRSALAAVVDFGRWLPAADPADGDHPEPNARLRRASRRATGFVVGWGVVLVAGFTGVALAGAAADDLLHTGFHEPGVVVNVIHRVKGTSYIWVRHGDRTDAIIWESDRDYHVGEGVIVSYDPADPARVRTDDEPNENQVLLGFGVVPILAAVFGLPFSIGAAASWRRRIRAVERTGWRRAAVTDAGGAMLHARFRDGTAIELSRTSGFLALSPTAGLKNRPGWVGGWGRSMVVGLENGPPTVAVRATRERIS